MALTFLLQREREFDVRDTNSVISSFWKVVNHENEEVYQNVLTGVLSPQQPKEAKGGILADEVRVQHCTGGKMTIIYPLDRWVWAKPSRPSRSSPPKHTRPTNHFTFHLGALARSSFVRRPWYRCGKTK